MFKNFIILIQFFIIFSLMVQQPQNLDIIVKDVATAKNMAVNGAEYLQKTFDKEFSVHEEGVIIEDKDATIILPKLNNEKVNDSGFTPLRSEETDEGKIIEETWFNEK